MSAAHSAGSMRPTADYLDALGGAVELNTISPLERPRATGLAVRRVILWLTSKPTAMGWLCTRAYGFRTFPRNDTSAPMLAVLGSPPRGCFGDTFDDP